MKKAGEESPAAKAQFSMKITIQELLVSVKQDFLADGYGSVSG